MTKNEMVQGIERLIYLCESNIRDLKDSTDDLTKGYVIANKWQLEELKALLK